MLYWHGRDKLWLGAQNTRNRETDETVLRKAERKLAMATFAFQLQHIRAEIQHTDHADDAGTAMRTAIGYRCAFGLQNHMTLPFLSNADSSVSVYASVRGHRASDLAHVIAPRQRKSKWGGHRYSFPSPCIFMQLPPYKACTA